MQRKLTEARAVLQRAWQLNCSEPDVTSGRILWSRIAVAALAGEDIVPYIGLAKSLLLLPELHAFGWISSVWQIRPVSAFLRPQLSAAHADLLEALAAALNNRNELAALESHPDWRYPAPLPLETEWPQ